MAVCYNCNGKGNVEEKTDCPQCFGSGSIATNCNVCGGKGYLMMPVPTAPGDTLPPQPDIPVECTNCQGRKVFVNPDPYCYGRGYLINVKTCFVCGGTGELF